MNYDELILNISSLNREANKLCEDLADRKHKLNDYEKSTQVKEILEIWAKADVLLSDFPEE